MSESVFPPVVRDKKGFFNEDVYRLAVERYPTVADLVREKAKENKGKVWLEYQDGSTYTYEQVDALTNKIASGLYRAGARADDHVAIFGPNSPQWVLCYLGVLKLGAVPVTVNTGFIKDALVYNLTAAKAKYLIIDQRLLPRYREVEASLGGLERVFIIGKEQFQAEQAPGKPYGFAEELIGADHDPAHLTGRLPGDPSAMILTSGTTGPSKVVYDTNAQFITTALFLIDAGGITADSVIYNYLPLFHIMALDMATVLSMLANAKVVLVESFDPTVFWTHVRKYGVTQFPAVGPILEMLMKMPPSDLEKDHGPITAIAYCSKEIWSRAKERFDINITGGYGSTEVGIPISAPHDIVSRGGNPPGSCGKVGPHVEVAIMDEQGRFAPQGTVGEIVVRPKLPWAIFREYFGMPEATAEAFRGLWFHTGDAGCFDPEGYLYFVDRQKDAIRRKGENISSYEVEQVLMKHHGIVQAAVVPVPNEVGDDDVLAVVVPNPEGPATPMQLVDFARENMPHFWVPRFIRFMEALPATPTGRIEKFKLKAEGVTPDSFDRKA